MIVTKLVLVLCLVVASVVGIRDNIAEQLAPDTITVEEALEFLKEAERAHQYYIDNPEECSEKIGSVKFHQMWLDRYRQIKEKLRGDGQD